MVILNFRNKWVCGNSDQEGPLSCPSWCPPPLSTHLVLTVLGEQAVQKEKVHIPKMPWKYSRPMAVKLLPILTLHCVYVTPLEKRLLSKALSYQSSEGLSEFVQRRFWYFNESNRMFWEHFCSHILPEVGVIGGILFCQSFGESRLSSLSLFDETSFSAQVPQ